MRTQDFSFLSLERMFRNKLETDVDQLCLIESMLFAEFSWKPMRCRDSRKEAPIRRPVSQVI